MKRMLIWATLLATGGVVATLALYLILIAVALGRANRNLERLVGGLESIRDNTAPLLTEIGTINGAASALLTELSSVEGHLQEIIENAR